MEPFHNLPSLARVTVITHLKRSVVSGSNWVKICDALSGKVCCVLVQELVYRTAVLPVPLALQRNVKRVAGTLQIDAEIND